MKIPGIVATAFLLLASPIALAGQVDINTADADIDTIGLMMTGTKLEDIPVNVEAQA